MNRYLIFLILYCNSCFSQTGNDSIYKADSNPIFYANRLSTHPFGIFSSRVNHNFQTKSAKKISLAANISNGNVWLPNVKAYIPLDETDIYTMQNYIWHEREAFYDEENSPSKTIEFHADGVIRFYQINLNIPLSAKHELKINTRAFSIDAGKVPYSLLTSDRFIEWFHSNISGGEDPFARKHYGLEHALIRYTDNNGKNLEINEGDLMLSGIDLSYSYYPVINSLAKKNIYTNISVLLGANVSHINPSLDLGFNSSIIKEIDLRNRKKLRLGLSISTLHQKIIRFGEGIQLTNKKLLLGSEFLVNYTIPTKKNGSVTFATTYFAQNSFNKRSEYKSIVLTGERISTHWHYSISHLYRVLAANYFIVTYSKGIFAFSIYIREDFAVDNAPDAQAGFGVRMSFK